MNKQFVVAKMICKLFLFAVLPSCDKYICYCIAERISVFHGVECFRTKIFSQWHTTISTLQLCGSCSSKHVCSSYLLLPMPIGGWGSGAMLCSTVGLAYMIMDMEGELTTLDPGVLTQKHCQKVHMLCLWLPPSLVNRYMGPLEHVYILTINIPGDYKYSKFLISCSELKEAIQHLQQAAIY